MGNCCGPRRSYSGIADQTSELTTALITEDYYADSAHSSQPSSAATAAAAGIPIDSAVRMNAEVVDFSTAEMERATNKFSGRNKVDEGSFGEVYRGKLADGRIAAIKVLRLARLVRDRDRPGSAKYTGEATFRREVEVLGKYRHPNVVALLGQCMGKAEMRPCLVYEFMEGQSLEERLNPKPKKRKKGGLVGYSRAAQKALPPLAWRERIAVVADTARGLEFLHALADPPIIHQDIKSANILLGSHPDNGTLIAKLADFGTARIAPKLLDDTHVSTMTVVGTGPYMPPEYTQEGHVSEKTDTYAFGVVLLEILTGLFPKDPRSNQPLALAMAPALDNPKELLPQLLDRRAGDWDTNATLALAAIARGCTELHSHRRLAVSQVRRDLDFLAGRDKMQQAEFRRGLDRSLVQTDD